jgi:chemotaxis protein methyltransferase CheR/type IV pilus assembly protein PilK
VLVDRLTVQETCFFRHLPSYALVKNFLHEKAAKTSPKQAIEMWSVGCSSGEEVYSLAILAEECLSKRHRYYGITGTDVSLAVLAKAKKAIYPERKLLNLNDQERQQFFSPIDKNQYAVNAALKERVCFAQLNVLNLNHAPMHGMDIIYCQNMLIYFRKWRRREIVNRLAERLAPGGLLILGLGEVVDWQHPELDRVNDQHTLAFVRRAK